MALTAGPLRDARVWFLPLWGSSVRGVVHAFVMQLFDGDWTLFMEAKTAKLQNRTSTSGKTAPNTPLTRHKKFWIENNTDGRNPNRPHMISLAVKQHRADRTSIVRTGTISPGDIDNGYRRPD